jgi:dTDP-4-amino-4,6-dideoxygalactose transaminase
MLCDAAQGFGGLLNGRRSGGIGDAAATSFFPAKPLGCFGDGGASFTNDSGLDELLRSIRMHGQGVDRYENVRIGVNSRLDTIQAAILIEKMKIFPEEIEMRDAIARRYSEKLGQSNRIRVPRVIDGATSTWAQYTIQVPERDRLASDLKAKGIPSAIYYTIPMPRQKAYAQFPSAPVPASEKISKTVISLPMHPYLDAATQDMIVGAVVESVGHA